MTYKNLSAWYKELRHYRPEIPCILVANKIDGILLLQLFGATCDTIATTLYYGQGL